MLRLKDEIERIFRATYAQKLEDALKSLLNVGSSTLPVYFEDGVPKAITFGSPTADQILSWDGSAYSWINKPAANVSTSAVLAAAADGKQHISANTSNPYYNLLEGTNITRSILFKAGTNMEITTTVAGVITFNAINTWQAYVAPTEDAAGIAGYITPPTYENRNKFLRGDGTWQIPIDSYSYLHLSDWDYNIAHNSNYVTFDKDNGNGGPSNAWYNGFVSTYNNYLSSYLVNKHRTHDWYLGWNEDNQTARWTKIITAANISSQSVNYANYAGYATRLDGGAIASWGYLTSSNGFSGIAACDWGDKGAFCWAGKGGQMYMQVDGFFYQNEGRYKVLDEYDISHTKWGDADTVDSLHASNFVRFFLSPMTSGAPADSAKSWFTGTMPSASGAIIYNVPGSEKTIIAGKSSGSYGHMLQLNYDDTYLRILRYADGSWKSTDWEKISAGYADSAGNTNSLGSGALVHMCSLHAHGSYSAYKITTNWHKSWNIMPTINIRGYAYGSTSTIDCDIVMYHFENTTYNYSLTNKGSYPIRVWQAIENDVQVFYINPGEYFGMFNVFVYSGQGTSLFSGWSMTTVSDVAGSEISKKAIATSITGDANTVDGFHKTDLIGDLIKGVWNPRNTNLAMDWCYNGGDMSISESGGQIYVSIDGTFWQREGAYMCLDTGNYSSYALPLSGGTLTGTLHTATGLGIEDATGNGLLVYHPSSWTGISSSLWGAGAIDSLGVIRSSNSDLVHYKHGAGSYNILDSSNYSSYAVTLATALTISGAKTFTNTISYSNDGTLKIYGVLTCCGTENIAFQTAFDYLDPLTSSYPTSYPDRAAILLLPRGGRVGINVARTPSYTLHVVGDIYTSGYSRAGNGFIKNDSSNSYVLLGGGGHAPLTNLQVVGTATSVTSLNVELTFIYATLTESATLGLSKAMTAGQVLTVLVDNTGSSAITITIPPLANPVSTTGPNWYSLDGYSLTIPSGKKCEISILCFKVVTSGSNIAPYYLVSAKSQ